MRTNFIAITPLGHSLRASIGWNCSCFWLIGLRKTKIMISSLPTYATAIQGTLLFDCLIWFAWIITAIHICLCNDDWCLAFPRALGWQFNENNGFNVSITEQTMTLWHRQGMVYSSGYPPPKCKHRMAVPLRFTPPFKVHPWDQRPLIRWGCWKMPLSPSWSTQSLHPSCQRATRMRFCELNLYEHMIFPWVQF